MGSLGLTSQREMAAGEMDYFVSVSGQTLNVQFTPVALEIRRAPTRRSA